MPNQVPTNPPTINPRDVSDTAELYKGRMTKEVAAHMLGYRMRQWPTEKPDTIAEADDNRGVHRVWKPKGSK
jgi:hypothetical protein